MSSTNNLLNYLFLGLKNIKRPRIIANNTQDSLNTLEGIEETMTSVVGGNTGPIKEKVVEEILDFSETKKSIVPFGDYNFVTPEPLDEVGSGSLKEETLVLQMNDSNTITLDLSNNSKTLYGAGFIEISPYVYRFQRARNANSTAYHVIKLLTLNNKVLSATSEFSESIKAVPFVDIPDEPTNFFYLKHDTNIDDGDTFNWTDTISGINIPNGQAGKPTKDASGFVSFNGTSAGLDLLGNQTISGVFGNLPAIAAIHMTVKFPDVGSTQINPISIYDKDFTYKIFRPIVLGSTGVLRAIHRTANTSDQVVGEGTTTLVQNQWYTISVAYKADNRVDVYLNGVLEIADINLNNLANAANQFDAFSLGYKNLNGGETYEECDIDEVVISSSLSNFNETMNKLISNKNTNFP
jgi:hypothetical protein